MNKLVKGSIAGAAGIALLLGGAGSLALWNAEADVAPGTVTAGSLTITEETNTGWWDASAEHDPAVAITDIAAFRTVPGDALTFQGEYTISATGNNLKAQVTTNIDEITDSIDGVTTTVEVKVGGVVVADNDVVTLASGDTNASVTVQVSFDRDATGGMDGTLDLGSLNFLVEQVRPVITP